MAQNGWRSISWCFLKFFNKFNFKNTPWYLTIHKQCTKRFKIGQIRSFLHGIWLKILWTFWTSFFSLVTTLNISSICMKSSGVQIENILSLNVRLFILNISFIFYNFTYGAEWLICWYKLNVKTAGLRQNMGAW